MVPGACGGDGLLANSIVGSGTVIAGAVVRRSILSSRVRVEEGAVVEDALLFDNVTVGAGARLRRCIIDKGVHVPAGEAVGFDLDKDRQRFTVSEKGVVVVPKEYVFSGQSAKVFEHGQNV
jgi:glucose-1-phosphate adenylyltransferase